MTAYPAAQYRVIPELTPDEIVRFYSKLRIDGCGVRWAGPVNNNGYGRFEIYRNGRRVRILAHRLAYKLATGEDPGPSKIRHGCDTPPCCTPDCMTTGTQADNVHDAIARGRLIHRTKRATATEHLASGEKRCARCKRIKPLTEFSRQRRRLDGRMSDCKACWVERKQARKVGSRP